MRSLRSAATVLACGLSACAPALDWRDVRPDQSGVVALFPCKPASHARTLPLAGASVRFVLYACAAGDATWSLGFAELSDPARVGPALDQLREQAALNIAAHTALAHAFRVPGSTPNPREGLDHLAGRLPDGTAVQERVGVFAKGTRVFRATVLSSRLSAEHAEAFFDSLRVER